MNDLSAYSERALIIYRDAFASPLDDNHAKSLNQLVADMRAAGVNPDRISLLLRSAMNDVQRELTP